MTEDEYRQKMVEQMEEIDASLMLIVDKLHNVFWVLLLIAFAACGNSFH